MNQHPLYALAENWPADLLIDYILKIHHRGIRDNGPGILARFRRAVEARPADRELAEACALFEESLIDLDMHLMKEENVLFPFVLELFEADRENLQLEQMHCGSVANPIHVMEDDHEGEVQRYARIAQLTHVSPSAPTTIPTIENSWAKFPPS